MSAAAASPRDDLIPGMEVRVEPDAGITLVDTRRWWGTRIYWRRPPQRRWEKALLLDVHPFDRDALTAFLQTREPVAP